MATSVTASYAIGDTSEQRLRPPAHVYQSILPLRRERTIMDKEFNQNGTSKSAHSPELSVRSSAFAGEKQYNRRQVSTQLRSAKSEEIFHLIDRKLQIGIHGVRHLFRSNDPNQAGKLSKEAFRRVLTQLCGYINNEEWEKVSKMFHLNARDSTITFEEFVSYFPDNEKVKHELSTCQSDRVNSSLLTLSHNMITSQQSYHKDYLPRLTANYCYLLMKRRCHDPSFEPNDYLPLDCLNDGVIIRDHLKQILKNFQLTDIIDNQKEFEKLWSKFDLDNTGMIRTTVFLRLLDYRVNMADEINANIQRLASHSSSARNIDRSSSSSLSGKQRQVFKNKNQDHDDDDEQLKYTPPPSPSNLDQPSDETMMNSDGKFKYDEHESSSIISSTVNASTKALDTKFRTLVQKHRRMTRQLNETDEFVPFIDRKVNEGYFCLKTIFSYLDPNRTNLITKEQLIAALNQFDIPISLDNINQFLRKHHCKTVKTIHNVDMIDHNAFLKYFQDRFDASFLSRTLNTFNKDKSQITTSDLTHIEDDIIDLLHSTFLSLTAATINYISNDSDDLCSEKDLFLILKKELGIADNYRFTDKQKDEIYTLLNCTDDMRQKRELPYKRLLYLLIKTTISMNKFIDYSTRTMPVNKQRHYARILIEKKPERNSSLPPRNLSYIEKTLYDLIHLRMHKFTQAFSYLDQPRTDKINKEQFYKVLQDMDTDLTRSEVNLIWSSSGFHMDKSIPFANLIRQIIMFTRDEKKSTRKQLQRAQTLRERPAQSAATSRSTRTLVSSAGMSDVSSVSQSTNYREIYNRILPYVRQQYNRIKNELFENDPTACGSIDFSVLQDIFHHYSIPINDEELGALIRIDDPRNGSIVQYPFFIRKYHPDGPVIRTSPWLRVHPIYEQLVQKQYAKHPVKEVHDQRTQNPRDLKNLIHLFHSYDKPRKGFLTNDEYYSLLHDNGITLTKSDEDYYQLFSKYDRQLRDQFNYIDLFHTIINSIMS